MTDMQDVRKKSDAELTEMVAEGRKTIREERFKTSSVKAGVIGQKLKLHVHLPSSLLVDVT